MTISIVEWAHTYDPAPVTAGSRATSSNAYTAGVLYLVCATQMRVDDTNPSVPGCSGMGVTWENINGDEALWDSTTSSRRRTDLWWARPASSGTGAITITYGSDPGSIDIMVMAATGADDIVRVVDANHTCFTNSMVEPVAMPTPASGNNRIAVFVIGNIPAAATARLEEATDPGGDATWTQFSVLGGSSSPTSVNTFGWYDGPAVDDLTPGWYHNHEDSSNSYMVAIELSATMVAAGATPYFGIEATFGAPGAPSGVGFLIGAATSGSPHPDTTNAWEAKLGGRHMQISRRYDSGIATDITSPSAGNGTNEFSQDIGVRHRAISMKETVADAGVSQASWQTFIASIPVDGFITWITAHHEPDNDGGSHNATWFRTKIIEPMHAAWVAQGSRADVKLYVCFTVSNYSTAVSMFPAAGLIGDFAMLLDSYDHGAGVTRTKCEPFVTAWKSAGGTAWGIGEYGTLRTGTDQADAVTTSIQWMRSDPDAIIFLWWDDVGVDDWRLLSPANDEAIAALAAQMDLAL